MARSIEFSSPAPSSPPARLVRDDGDRVRFRGPFCVSEGELVTLTGQWKKRSQIWTAVRCEERELRSAETPEGLVQYLAKHPAFTGIGEPRRERSSRTLPAQSISIA